MLNLLEARGIARVTQWALVAATKMSQGKISLIENGHLKAKENEKKALARALSLRVEEIDWREETQA